MREELGNYIGKYYGDYDDEQEVLRSAGEWYIYYVVTEAYVAY